MKKILLLFVVMLFLIPINAEAVTITSSPISGTTQLEKTITYQITVTNERGDPDKFILTVFGSRLEWANLQSYYFELEPHESIEISLNFYPLEEGDYQYKLQVRSVSSQGVLMDIHDSVNLNLKVNPLIDPDQMPFPNREIVYNEEPYLKRMKYSRKTRDVVIAFDIMDSENNKVKVLSITREVEGEISETISLEGMLSGLYSVKVSLVGSDISRIANFYVSPVRNIVTSKKTVSNPLTKEVTITISNQGNVVDDYSVEESMSANQYVTLIDDPSMQYVEEDEVVFQWGFTGLQVGQTIQVKYTVDYWKHNLGWAIVGLSILGILGLGVVKMRRPNIQKRHVRKRNAHMIVLEVRGSLTRELKNVLVKDRVSPLGKVLPEFDGPKPIVRESEAGTELIWRLGDVKPRSEIYLSYKIRPLIEAQLKMPQAYLTYRTDDERKIKVFSKQLMLE